MYLTRRQRDVLQFIETFIEEQGHSPSLAEIARGVGLKSIATVHQHLKNLERKELITRGWNRGRSIELLPGEASKNTMEVPLLGRISAGSPIEAVEVPEFIGLPQGFINSPDSFVLSVSGESMIDEGIRDGDFIICERRANAHNGETVVALLKPDNTVTVKIFQREGKHVHLQPANKKIKPIHRSACDIEIQGIVIGLLRKY